MKKYFFIVTYNGRGFRGWQNQKDGLSVQETIELAFIALFKTTITIHGCGRTDAGVHGQNYVFHAVLPSEVDNLIFKLNNKLPAQIAVKSMTQVSPKANAQLDAISRTYTYYVHFTKDPYLNNFSTYYFIENLNLNAIEQACVLITEARDFKNFCLEPAKHKSTLCKIEKVELFKNPTKNQIAFRFHGDHYLRSMIRMLVGELLEIGKGKTTLDAFKNYLNVEVNIPKHHKAYAQGLHLSAVQYTYFKTELEPPF